MSGNTRPLFKELLSEFRGTMFAIRTQRKEMKYEDLRYLLGDALIHAAQKGAGFQLEMEEADNMAAYLLDGMLPTCTMPNDYGPVEDAITKALDQGTEAARARARGLAQALAMIKYPRSWRWASNKDRVDMVRKEME